MNTLDESLSLEAEAILTNGKNAVFEGRPLFKRQTLIERIQGKPEGAASVFAVDPKVILGSQGLRRARSSLL